MAVFRFKNILVINCLILISTIVCGENLLNSQDITKLNDTLEVSESKNIPVSLDQKHTLDKSELTTEAIKLNQTESLETPNSKSIATKGSKELINLHNSEIKVKPEENLETAESKHTSVKANKPETLEEAESKDNLEIIKRIKKINNDGSYTIGYEADDGSFKIESRDVLGNVKGTYGFVDENGEIKRISYSTNNSSHIFAKPQAHPEISVVQRIPKISSITPRPTFASTTTSPSSSTSRNFIQTIGKKRPFVPSSTTQRPKYVEIRTTSKLHAAVSSTPATPRVLLQRPSILTPVKKQQSEGQLARPETVSQKPTQISLFHTIPNKKIIDEEEKPVTEDRSEVSDVRTNDLRRQLPHVHSQNIQEIQSRASDEAEHYQYIYHHDTQDVYNTGMTEIVRPLFTTSGTPRKLFPILSGSTRAPVVVTRPTRYPNLYQRGYNSNPEVPQSNTISNQLQKHVSSTEAPSSPVPTIAPAPTIAPVVQIPANKPEIRYAQTPEEIKYAQSATQRTITNTIRYDQNTQSSTSQRTVPVVFHQDPDRSAQYPQEPQRFYLQQRSEDPLVAIRHPFHKGAILVPLSQLQGNVIPIENVHEVQQARRNFVYRNQQQELPSATEVQIEKQKLLRVNNGAPPLRPIPVQVDSNGFIREVPPNVPTPYPLPIPITPVVPVSVPAPPISKYVSTNEVGHEIDDIEPPVSTRDFQKLLHQLVLRQKKLEKLNDLMRAKEVYQHQVQPVLIRPVPVQVTPVPYVIRKLPQSQAVPQHQAISQNYRGTVQYEPQPQESDVTPTEVVILPRRVYAQMNQALEGRYLHHNGAEDESIRRRTSRQYDSENHLQDRDEYLPSEVREMLLLKMLKLAINPALPIDENEEQEIEQEIQTPTIDSPQYKRAPVRNVEILGEENSEDSTSATLQKNTGRSKRDKEEDMEVME